MHIYLKENKDEEKFLRKKTQSVEIAKFQKGELQKLIKQMRLTMKKANGIGLSANQIGLSHKIFVAEIPDEKNQPKFYAVLNPIIVKFSSEKDTMEEGCLSVPETYGSVERPYKITLEGEDTQGKKIKIKAWGLLARVFQHEMDHLGGILFIDKAKDIKKIEARIEKIK